MKKQHIQSYIYLFACLLLLAGCASQTAERENIMQFRPLYPGETLSRATDAAFEVDDSIGVYVTDVNRAPEIAGNYVTNALLRFDGGWQSAQPIYWNGGTYDVYAYYPYCKVIPSTFEMPFAVQTDQTGKGLSKSDFLHASRTAVKASNEGVALPFKHCMSRVHLTLTKGDTYTGELPEKAEVYVLNTVTQARVDLRDGTVMPYGMGKRGTVKAHQIDTYTYAAIVVPQRIDSRVPIFEVVVNDIAYAVEARFQYRPGILHIVHLILEDNPDKMRIEIGGEVDNWTETPENATNG